LGHTHINTNIPLHDLQSAELRKQRSIALCQKLQELGGGDKPVYSFRDWPGVIRSITKVRSITNAWIFSRYELTIDVAAPLSLRGQEHHETAAKSHRAAAEHHGKNDHAKGQEHAKQAQQHSQSARDHSEEAHKKSGQQQQK
jgi:hypothetical protein